MWRRILALVIKELLVVLKDTKSRIVLIGVPLIQLLVFPHAATFEVSDIRIMVMNADRGAAGRELVAAFSASDAVTWTGQVTSEAQLRGVIERGEADMVLRIDESLSADLAAGRPARVQIVLDGRNSNTALVIADYARQIVAAAGPALAAGGSQAAPPDPVVRALYNPNLLSKWFIMPGLVGILVLVVVLAITAFSIAREKEIGTYDQLLVTPLRPIELAIGKTVPALLVGLAESAVFVAVTSLGYGVPLAGSLALLFLAIAVFLLSVVGIGLMVSTVSSTQQQALFGAFLFVVPAVILSGFATPIENMPEAIQKLTLVNPLRYFLVISRGVFLKDLPVEVYWSQLLPMLAIAAITLAAASVLFRRRVG